MKTSVCLVTLVLVMQFQSEVVAGNRFRCLDLFTNAVLGPRTWPTDSISKNSVRTLAASTADPRNSILEMLKRLKQHPDLSSTGRAEVFQYLVVQLERSKRGMWRAQRGQSYDGDPLFWGPQGHFVIFVKDGTIMLGRVKDLTPLKRGSPLTADNIEEQRAID